MALCRNKHHHQFSDFMRIQIPKNPEELIKLAKAVRDKHVALGAASPLNGIAGIAGFSAQVDTADSSHTDAKGFAKQAETATETRDNALGPDTNTPGTVRFVVTAARDLLAAQNKGSEHKLGDWGYVVDASTQPTPQQKADLKAAKAAVKAAKNQKAA